MKIEIDLNDIFGDELGNETLNESIKRQVIENITETLNSGVVNKVNEEVNKQISEAVRTAVVERMDDIFNDVLTAKYTPITRYGSVGNETTFRDEIVNVIFENMVYKPNDYNKNSFTKAIEETISQQIFKIKKDFNEQCNTAIAKQAFNEAVELLRNKLKV